MLLHGPVRVAKDAKAGKVMMQISLPSTSQYRFFPTDLPVVIR
jgi:hypothetical protein